jgi:hypothetical protein
VLEYLKVKPVRYFLLILLLLINCNKKEIYHITDSSSLDDLTENQYADEPIENDKSNENEQDNLPSEKDRDESNETFYKTDNLTSTPSLQKVFFQERKDIIIREIQTSKGNFIYSNNYYEQQIKNNSGEFYLPSSLNSQYLELKVTVKYYNEINGDLLENEVTLSSYSSIQDNLAPSINILTTLGKKRIKYLILHENIDFHEAETQVITEVLNIFSIQEEIGNLDQLKINGSTNGDAILLATSLIIQKLLIDNNTPSIFISKIQEDLKEDGVIDDIDLLNSLVHQSKLIDVIKVRKNLKKYYEENNIDDYKIPFFEDYLDSDSNGIINKNDPESFIIFKDNQSDQFYSFSDFTIHSYKNKLWLVNQSGLHYSDDLKNWSSYDNSLDLSVSNPVLQTWQDKLYIFGGYDCGTPYIDSDEEICIATKGVYTLDNELNLNKLKYRGFDDLYHPNDIEPSNQSIEPDLNFINDNTNDDIDDNTHANFIAPYHDIKVFDDKLYAYTNLYYPYNDNNEHGIKLISSQFRRIVSEDGINWSDEVPRVNIINRSDLLDFFFVVDIFEINNSIYALLDNNHGRGLYKKIIRDDGSSGFFPVYTHNPIYLYSSAGNYYLEYDSKVLFNSYQGILGDEASLQLYLFKGEMNISIIDIPEYFKKLKLTHKPFLYKNFVHYISDDSIVSLGKYKHYKSYKDLIIK